MEGVTLPHNTGAIRDSIFEMSSGGSGSLQMCVHREYVMVQLV